MAEEKLAIIGRERALIDKLTKQLHAEARRHYDHTEARRHYDHTDIRTLPRGNWFEVVVADGRRVARVEVTFDRVEPEEIKL